MNELLLLLEIIVVFSALMFVHKFFGKTGIFIWVGVMGVLAQLLTTKQVNLFGIQAITGTVQFASLFLATDILNECYGEKEARKAPYFIILFTTLSILITQIVVAYAPNELDYVHDSMALLFSQTPRIALSSLFMLFVASRFNVAFFDKLSKRFNGKHLWLRNNLSTILTNAGENFFFMFFAFYKNPIAPMGMKEVVIVAISTSLIELLVAFADTPFVYLARKLRNENKRNS